MYITISINNSEIKMPEGSSVSDALSAGGLTHAGIAVAVESKVLPRSEWAGTRLREGMHLTVIRAVCGG